MFRGKTFKIYIIFTCLIRCQLNHAEPKLQMSRRLQCIIRFSFYIDGIDIVRFAVVADHV